MKTAMKSTMNTPVQIQAVKTENTDSGHITSRVPCEPCYNWNYFLNFQSKRLIESIENITAGHYRRTITIDNTSGWFEIYPETHSFIIKISKNFIHNLPAALQKIATIFDLQTNTRLIEDHLKKWYPFINIEQGLHIPGVPSAYEAGIRAICGQQVSVAGATRLLNQFVSLFQTVDINGQCYFPQPQNVAAGDIQQLKTMQSKKNTLFAFSQWCSNNNIEDNIDDLIALKGIGQWTINYIKLRALNHPNIWMGTDLGIKKIIGRTGAVAIEKAEPWQSYLTLHLWNNL